MKWVFLLALAAGPLSAQVLNVYSEFAKIDAQGNVVAPEDPREILSPALVRNGFTSFQVVVQVPPGTPYVLRLGQNPENAAKATFYKVTRTTLQRVEDPITGDDTQTFWMDVWVDKDAPVRRIKVEPQLQINAEWVGYPMEMRVRETLVPDAGPAGVVGASPFEMLRGYVCAPQPQVPQSNAKRTVSSSPNPTPDSTSDSTTPEGLHRRNARQDLAMASQLSASGREELRKWLGGCNARPSDNPEFYLHVRDYFWTPLWMKVAHGSER
jgi:hypothetical protein